MVIGTAGGLDDDDGGGGGGLLESGVELSSS